MRYNVRNPKQVFDVTFGQAELLKVLREVIKDKRSDIPIPELAHIDIYMNWDSRGNPVVNLYWVVDKIDGTYDVPVESHPEAKLYKEINRR